MADEASVQATTSSAPTPGQAVVEKHETAVDCKQCQTSVSNTKFMVLATLAVGGGVGAAYVMGNFKEATKDLIGTGSEHDDQVVHVLHTFILQAVAMILLLIFYRWTSSRGKAVSTPAQPTATEQDGDSAKPEKDSTPDADE